jgi:hypothetical protein
MTDHTNTYPDLVNVEDWLNAKGYTGEAGACHQAMSLIRSQERRIAELEEEIRSDFKEATAALEAQAHRIAELEAALDNVLTGGNHLALLIGSDHPLHTASHEEAMAHYGSRDIYEIWCCWRTMMNAGPILAARAALEKKE